MVFLASYPWTNWAENVAVGYSSPDAVMNAWMNSPGHRRNILSASVREIGIGFAQAGALQRLGAFEQCLLPHHHRPHARELSLGKIRKTTEQLGGDDAVEHAVPEELEGDLFVIEPAGAKNAQLALVQDFEGLLKPAHAPLCVDHLAGALVRQGAGIDQKLHPLGGAGGIVIEDGRIE